MLPQFIFDYFRKIYLGYRQRIEVVLFCVVRNEMKRLPFFMEYYRKKGVEKFYFIDNNSDDGTREWLLQQTDTKVFHSQGKFAVAAERHLNMLLQKFGVGKICVVVDADEFLRFMYDDLLDLQDLGVYMLLSKKNSLRSYLLDMYSRSTLERTVYQPGDDPFRLCSFFDDDTQFSWSKDIEKGVRWRVFGVNALLLKYPVVLFEKNMIMHWGAHRVFPHRDSNISGVVCHFKFFDDFISKVKIEAQRKEHWNNGVQYQHYAHKKNLAQLCLANDKSKQLVALSQLVAAKILVTHPLFWLYSTVIEMLNSPRELRL